MERVAMLIRSNILLPTGAFLANSCMAIAIPSGITMRPKNASKNGAGSTIPSASSPINSHKYRGKRSICVMKRIGVDISITFSFPRPRA